MTKSVYTDEYKKFRRLLRAYRKKSDVTQRELSKKLNMPTSFVGKYENGERRLDLIEFLDIADALGFDPHEFIDKLYDGD